MKILMKNKLHRSTRKIAGRVGIAQRSVVNIMKRSGFKAYHKYKVQKISDDQKEKRVVCAKTFLRYYGSSVRAGRRWSRLVNTDFSAKISISATRNSKNDVVWSDSRHSASELLEAPSEKFTKGHMIWGGVCYRGLVPRDAPIFVEDLYQDYQPRPSSLNSAMYADMIRERVGPAVSEVYTDGTAIFQDDGASIHRAEISLEAVRDTFETRVNPTLQALKMADI